MVEIMDEKQLNEYLEDFENKVILPGLEQNLFGRKIKVQVKGGKLRNSDFGKFVGLEFKEKKPVAIDYYGLVKKSTGFARKLKQYEDLDVKAARIPVVHFAAVKIEHITDLAPELLAGFAAFKKHLVKLRGFKKDGTVKE
jgi:hypothetical protein